MNMDSLQNIGLKIYTKALKVFWITKWALIFILLSTLVASFGGPRCISQATFNETETILEEFNIPANGVYVGPEGTLLDYNSRYDEAIIAAENAARGNQGQAKFGQWYNTRIGADLGAQITITALGNVYLKSEVVNSLICPDSANKKALQRNIGSGCNFTIHPNHSSNPNMRVGRDTVAHVSLFNNRSCDLDIIDEENSPDEFGNDVKYNVFEGVNCASNSSFSNKLIYKIDDYDLLPNGSCADYIYSNMVGMHVDLDNVNIFNGVNINSSYENGVMHIPTYGLVINGAQIAPGPNRIVYLRPETPPAGYTLNTSDDFQVTTSLISDEVVNSNSLFDQENGALEVYLSADDINADDFVLNENHLHVVSGSVLQLKDAEGSSSSATIWLRVRNRNSDLSVADYQPLKGSYSVKIETQKVHNIEDRTFLTGFIPNRIIAPIKQSVQDSTIVIYDRTVNNPDFKFLLRIFMQLAVIIYAYAFFTGRVQAPLKELVGLVLKIAIVNILISDQSWQFFNDHLFIVFDEGVDELIAIIFGQEEFSHPLVYLEDGLGVFLNFNVWLKILALMVTPVVGVVGFILALMIVYLYVGTAIQVILSYLACIVIVGFMVSLSPLFIAFILFRISYQWFQNWVKFMLMLSLYPFFLMLGVYLIYEIMMAFLIAMLNYKVCSDTWFHFIIPPGLLDIPIKTYMVDFDSIGFGLGIKNQPLNDLLSANTVFGGIYLLANMLLAYLFLIIAQGFASQHAAWIIGKMFGEYSLPQIISGGEIANSLGQLDGGAMKFVSDARAKAKEQREQDSQNSKGSSSGDGK